LCERVHAFAQTILQNSIEENIHDWDSYLPAVRFAIMTSSLDGFGFSPYELLYGRRARLPVDSIMPLDSGVPRTIREYYQSHLESIKQIRDMFDYTQSKVDARMRYRRDKSQRRRPTDIRPGDLVYHSREYYNQDAAERGLRKLLGKFAGPSLVTRKLGTNTFEVQVDGKTRKIFNVEHLAPYKGESLPLYRPKPDSSLSGLRIGEDVGDDIKSSQEPESFEEGGRPEIPEADPNSPKSGDLRIQGDDLPVESKIDPERPVISESPSTHRYRAKRRAGEMENNDIQESPEKRIRLDTLNQDSEEKLEINSSIGQWVLVLEKRLLGKGKKSLFLGKVVEQVQKEGVLVDTVHVWKPKGVQKERNFLPHWYRMHDDGINYDLATTDARLPSSWQPWLVDLDDKFIVVRKSTLKELVRSPPERLVYLYDQVWDNRLGEESLIQKTLPSNSNSTSRVSRDPTESPELIPRRSARKRKAKF